MVALVALRLFSRLQGSSDFALEPRMGKSIMAGRNVLLGSASLVLLNVCMVWGQQDPLPLKMEDFTTEPADWVGLRNRDAGLETDYGFSETNNAGGSAGEIGGRLPERNNAAASYYADLSVGGAFELSCTGSA